VSDPAAPSAAAPWPSAPPGSPGLKVGFPESRLPMPPGHRTGHRTMIMVLLACLGVVTLLFVVIAIFAPPPPAPHCGSLQCQGPPIGHPNATEGGPARVSVTSGVLYANSQGFSLRYIPSSQVPSPTVTSTATSGITLVYPLGQGATTQLQVVGEPAGGTTAQGMVQAIVNEVAPGAQPVYQVPGAMIGYMPGFGEAYDLQSASSGGSTTTLRIIVIAAIHNNFGIAAIASGALLDVTADSPLYAFAPHPSPADVAVAYLASLGDPVVNSITFPSA